MSQKVIRAVAAELLWADGAKPHALAVAHHVFSDCPPCSLSISPVHATDCVVLYCLPRAVHLPPEGHTTVYETPRKLPVKLHFQAPRSEDRLACRGGCAADAVLLSHFN